MKKARSSKLVGLLGLAALATSLMAAVAGAREKECTGDFTLTSETRWGQAVLPPGSYSFELDLTNDLITIRGQHVTVTIMSQVHDTDNRVESNALVLVSRGGKGTVRALQLARQKAVLVYAIPKQNREELAQEPAIIQRVPVTINGK